MTSSNTSNKNNKKLPWWVELLFVQIGLPDKWLPRLLKSKKNTVLFLSENRKSIFYILLIIISATYIKPIVKESYNKNKCINWASNYIKNEIEVNKSTLNAKAHNYCNGGIDF